MSAERVIKEHHMRRWATALGEGIVKKAKDRGNIYISVNEFRRAVGFVQEHVGSKIDALDYNIGETVYSSNKTKDKNVARDRVINDVFDQEMIEKMDLLPRLDKIRARVTLCAFLAAYQDYASKANPRDLFEARIEPGLLADISPEPNAWSNHNAHVTVKSIVHALLIIGHSDQR